MDSIKVEDGQKHIAIIDAKGKPRGEIVFSPEDIDFVERLEKIIADMEALGNDFRQRASELEQDAEIPKGEKDAILLKLAKEFHIAMREKIDYLLGPGTSEMVFGSLYTFRAIESFLNGLASYVQPVRTKKVEQYLPANGNERKPRSTKKPSRKRK